MTSGAKAIVVYDKRILLVQRDNNPNIPFPNMWDLPGGAQEENETLENTVTREIEEEFGINPTNIINLGTEIYGERHGGRFLVNLTTKEFEMLQLGDEGQRFDFFAINEITDLDMVPNLKEFVLKNKEILKRNIEEGIEINLNKIILSKER